MPLPPAVTLPNDPRAHECASTRAAILLVAVRLAHPVEAAGNLDAADNDYQSEAIRQRIAREGYGFCRRLQTGK